MRPVRRAGGWGKPRVVVLASWIGGAVVFDIRRGIVIGLIFLGMVLSGFWMKETARPGFPGLVHKLLAVSWVVLLVIAVPHASRLTSFHASHFAVITLLAVSVICMFVSGSLLTVPKFVTTTWLAVHRVGAVVAALATAAAMRLFLIKSP
jgi:hypothetical protein